MLESAILYLALCTASGNCRWEYAGTYHPSLQTQITFVEKNIKRVDPKFSGLQMCQQASRELNVPSERWKCVNAGFQRN